MKLEPIVGRYGDFDFQDRKHRLYFEEAGAGNLIKSWIGNGQNAPVSSDQLQNILGSDVVQKLASKTGLPVEQLLKELSQHLPAVVDAMTPNGQVPSKDQLVASGMSFLKSRLG